MTINIALPKLLVKRADQIAKSEYRNRSELIREALWSYLSNKEKWQNFFAYGKKMGKKAGIKSEADVDRIVYEFRHGKSGSRT